jgi:indole-3-glycerol phosphate synthase
MDSILKRIERYKRTEIENSKLRRPLGILEREARTLAPPRGFIAAIERRLDQGETALITEIKRQSPSKGLIRVNFAPPELARAYCAGGATCLSVVTDGPSFGGMPEHLAEARGAAALPALRKDFIFDPYQVVEARALGADAILIILAAVDDYVAKDCEEAARALQMDVLIEIHNEAELERASRLHSRLIGINNRDLQTFETTLTTTERLAPRLPAGCVPVSESGIESSADLDRLRKVGVSTFLVGESLLRQPDVESATRSLRIGRSYIHENKGF